jgi:hypothetical protein
MGSSSTISPILVILAATVVFGTIDLTANLILIKLKGNTITLLFQRIASAAIGPRSFEGGSGTAAIGLGFHYFIALAISTTYYIASRLLPILNEHAILSGILYGIAVHLFMTFVVLPLSALKRPFSMEFFLTQLVIHMFLVGLPVALIVSYFA